MPLQPEDQVAKHEGTHGWSSRGFSGVPEAVDYSFDFTELWPRYTSFRRGGRSSSTCIPHVKLAPMSAPGPAGERQEHLDAAISFVGARQRRRLFRAFEILRVTWATGTFLYLPGFLKDHNMEAAAGCGKNLCGFSACWVWIPLELLVVHGVTD